MRRFTFVAGMLATLSFLMWLLARPVRGGDVAIPWRGPLTQLYWQDRLRGDVPALWCRHVEGPPGTHPLRGLFSRPRQARDVARRASERRWTDQLPTRAPTVCSNAGRPAQPGVHLDIDEGEVFRYARYWTASVSGAPALSDSISRTLSARFGSPQRCPQGANPMGRDSLWAWRAPSYSVTLTMAPVPRGQPDTSRRTILLTAMLAPVTCRAV